MIDLRHVQAFRTIVRFGSFNAAAKALSTTQPTISMWIRELERNLGAKLFDTRTRRAVLTSKGHEFVHHADELLGMAQGIERKMSGRTVISGLVRLGATETTAMTWLADLVARVKQTYPDIIIELTLDLPADLWRKYRAGSLDIIIGPEPESDPTIESRLLGYFQYSWMASPKLGVPQHRITPRDLATFPIISLSASSALYQLAERWFREADALPNWVNHCSSLSVVATLTRLAVGVSLLAPSLMAEEVKEGLLHEVDVFPRFPAASLFVTYGRHAASPTIEAILELIFEVCTFSETSDDA